MGQALRIDGITPAVVYILLSHVKRKSATYSLIDLKILQYSVLKPLNVSRETFEDFEEYSSLILSK